jgi:GNAT superfamily N-acetyltransferase
LIDYRLAAPRELNDLKAFLFRHGANPWNHLPVDGVDAEFQSVVAGDASALVACIEDQLVGLAIFYHPHALPEAYIAYSNGRPAIYIADVVVHQEVNGQGIGSALLLNILGRAPSLGAEMLVIDRHAENLASAGMMRKAGFQVLATFLDLDRRDSGNRSTTVLGLYLKP